MSSKEHANRLAKALESTGLVTVVKTDFSDDQVRLMCRVTKQPPNKDWIAVVHRILLATDFSRGYAHAWNAHICQLYFLKEDKGEKRIVFGWNLSIQASMMSEALDRIIKVVKGAQPKPEPKVAGEVEEMDLGGSFTGKRMAEKNGGGHNIGTFSPAAPRR